MRSHRKIQREDRRRRVLREETSGKNVPQSRARSDRNGRLQLYVEDAVAGAQPRITDFVPRRKYTLLVWLLLCLIPPALVQALFIWRNEYFDQALTQHTTAFRLVGSGTIATWCSSMLLMLASLVALTVYCVRRHKLDDYRGRYRLWLWAAAFCAFCSLDTIAALHRPLRAVMIYLTETNLLGDGSIWWMIVLGSVGSLVLLRVVLDTWRSRGTLLTLTFSMTCYACAALFYLRIFRIGPGEVDMMAYVGSLMTAHVLLAFSLLVYARFVCREASGEISAEAGKKSKKGSKRRWFSRRKQPPRPASGKKSKRVTQANDDSEDDADEDYEEVESDDLDELELLTDPKLSKSEVRKRRKKTRQQRRAA